MEEVMKDIDGKGNVALLLGPMGSDGQVGRSEGFDQVLADYPDVTVAFQDTADQGKFAADACADLLDGKEVDSETIVDNVYYTADNAQEALDAIAK